MVVKFISHPGPTDNNTKRVFFGIYNDFLLRHALEKTISQTPYKNLEPRNVMPIRPQTERIHMYETFGWMGGWMNGRKRESRLDFPC